MLKPMFVCVLCVMLVACMLNQPRYKNAPNGGSLIWLPKQIWLSGIKVADDEKTYSMPAAEENDAMRTASAGFLFGNNGKLVSEVAYYLSINIKKPYPNRVYTRAVLENPANPKEPVVYRHYLDPKDESIYVRHGPLNGLRMGGSYRLAFEIYADEQRQRLLSRIEQQVISPLDNTDGCVTMDTRFKREKFGHMKDPGGNVIPLDKIVFACLLS